MTKIPAGPSASCAARRERFRGCLLGGAVGDALGAPVEGASLQQIVSRFGQGGIAELAGGRVRVGAITDDTQMSMFTAEGLIRAHLRAASGIPGRTAEVVWEAYLRWLWTQGETAAGERSLPRALDGWLVGLPPLQERRGPGGTCLSALRSGRMGTEEQPLNHSKGCGGVMRAAPVGLAFAVSGSADAFANGCEIAALTHGHPSGYLAAGCLAAIVCELVNGSPIARATEAAVAELERRPGHEECARALEQARALALAGSPSAERVASLGEGWVAEEALAIAVYCALVADDFAAAVRLAVNHGGDSDSTGAITGNILGALWGVDAIPQPWLDGLELRETIARIAIDLDEYPDWQVDEHLDEPDAAILRRYPGW